MIVPWFPVVALMRTCYCIMFSALMDYYTINTRTLKTGPVSHYEASETCVNSFIKANHVSFGQMYQKRENSYKLWMET